MAYAAIIAAFLAVAAGVELAGIGREWSIYGHPLIAGAYLLLALLFLFIRLPTERETIMARCGAVLFFLGCGLHHVGMHSHILEGSPLAAEEWHHHVPTTMQLIGAPMFIAAAGPYLRDLGLILRRPTALRQLHELARRGERDA